MAENGNFMGLGVYINRGAKMDKLQEEIDQALKDHKPFVTKADSIEELAQKIGLSVTTLTETIANYNRFAANGVDEDYNKSKEYLYPVSKGPFYAFELGVGAFCTMGGLKISIDNEVLRENGQKIKGLYAVGNDSSGLVGDTYGPDKPGSCVGYAFYSGRHAAQHAKQYIASE
ncbi:FAD-binding protein [Streptococcus mutans]|nr:FAD-binding protein [Streptococcus mutans]MDT9577303.1 FAD-binding protein [Streptococcus mutans]